MKFNIATKLIFGYVFIGLLLVVVSVVSYINMNNINNGTNRVYEYGLVPVQQLGNIDTDMKQIRGDGYIFLLREQGRDAVEQSLAKYQKQVDEEISSYRETVESDSMDADSKEKLAILADMESNWNTYKSELNKIIGMAKEGRQDEAMALIGNDSIIVKARTAVVAAATKLDEMQTADVQGIVSDNKNAFSQALTIIIALAVASIIIALLFAIFMSRSITVPVNKVKNALQKMAKGDLTEKVVIKTSDETGAMAQAYNETQKYLNDLVAQLKVSSTQLSSASDQLSTAAKQSSDATQQVATSSQQMAKGAQEQSTNAQETSKSINQLSEVINQLAKGATEQSTGVQKAVDSITEVAHTLTEVAGNANLAAEGAKQAAEAAQSGAENSRQTLSGMDKIKASTGEVARKIEELGSRSAEIGKIVAVIDDIAAQTNLLALNAAIEAARAGEQGRGFAVVSDEVRKLAERSATATKEIADLIGNIQKGVKEATEVMAGGNAAVSEGYNLAVKAGQSLEQIQKASNHVNAQITQISVKAQQVNAATNELVKVIDSVGSITEENTAATEEMSASAAEVSKAVETVAGIAEENSAATEEVSASAQEMSAQVEEIVASSQTLKDMAVTLEQSVAMFKVEGGKENN
jgi:methyl-accepting chemotaxis protein